MKKIIGRDPSCDYVIFDQKNRVSRKHLELYFEHNSYYILDLNSTNGTYINGKTTQRNNPFRSKRRLYE
jgi:pSer/pThr/pTyr-binding forkhead associated (FHA) protein